MWAAQKMDSSKEVWSGVELHPIKQAFLSMGRK